jgi:two-component system phosphate regulon response regulator PhoB
MAKELIYIVEDEEDILELIVYNLTREGFAAKGFTRGEDMLAQIKPSTVGCIFLDLMLPGIDGLDVCKKIRGHKDETIAQIPIIMLTAKGEVSDVVTGLELGADDYIVKPFSPLILKARLKAVLRRKQQEKNLNMKPIESHGIKIHPGRFEVISGGREVQLTTSEFKALYFLISNPGWVFTRYQIIEEVHGVNYPVTDRSLDVLLVGLRKKLGKCGKYIESVRGIGYRFKDLQ